MDGLVPTVLSEGRAIVDNGGGGLLSWSYTVGLWHRHGWPELVICGLDSTWRARFLDQAIRVMEEQTDSSGAVDKELGVLFTRATEVDPGWAATRLLDRSVTFYQGQVPPHWQLVWTDADGNFPGEQGFDEKLVEAQPDLFMSLPDHRPGVWPSLGRRP